MGVDLRTREAPEAARVGSPRPLRVLILEDLPADARLVVSELRRAGYDPQWERVETEEEYLTRLETLPDLILADYNLPQFDAPRALQCLRKLRLDIPFIIVSGSIGEEIAVAAMREGATDYLLKDRLGRLGQAVAQALEQRQLRDTQHKAAEALRERTQLILLTADVGFAVNRANTLQEMVQQCTESLVHNLDVALARIWTLNEADNVLELQAGAGIDRQTDGPYARVPLGKFIIGRVAQDRAPCQINDLANDLHFADRQWAAEQGLIAFAGHPLIVEDRLVGALAVFSRHRLKAASFDALATVANQIAAGIDRKRTEERLRFTQFTIDHIATAVFWADSEGRFFNVNDAACALTGYRRDELLSLRVADLDLNGSPSGWTQAWQDLRHRRGQSTESRLRRKNGTEIPVSIHINLVPGAGRECSCSFVQDIIERKAVEFAQRQSELRFRAIFNQTFEFLGLLNADGTVLEVNQPALDFRGIRLADVAGLPLWETPWLDHSDETREQARQAVASAAAGHFVRNEIAVCDARGASRTFDFSAKPVLDDNGRVELLIVEARDITEQRQLEQQFRQAQKMEAVGKLAGGVAHDFNNLLTIIMGYSEMLQEHLRPPDPLFELVEQVHKAGERAAALTRQLLAFSRKQLLVPVVLDLNVLLGEMGKMFERLIGEDIALAFRPAADLWQVRVDQGQMEQVIMNLVVNARDAMPKGGQLVIQTANVVLDEADVAAYPDARSGEHVLLTVGDSGCGMDRATLAQIFEPFFSTKGEKGTGLGLATVYGIVKQSGGRITVESELGQGTTFRIYFPRDRESVALLRPASDSQRDLRGSKTVLLVEDEDAVRALARAILQHHGYKVLEARQGDEAIAVCNQYQAEIHLLATDVVMPSMSGRELAEKLLATRPNMKVLYLSGYMDDAVVRHGVLTTAVPFLQKPYTPSGLAKKVRDVLSH